VESKKCRTAGGDSLIPSKQCCCCQELDLPNGRQSGLRYWAGRYGLVHWMGWSVVSRCETGRSHVTGVTVVQEREGQCWHSFTVTAHVRNDRKQPPCSLQREGGGGPVWHNFMHRRPRSNASARRRPVSKIHVLPPSSFLFLGTLASGKPALARGKPSQARQVGVAMSSLSTTTLSRSPSQQDGRGHCEAISWCRLRQ